MKLNFLGFGHWGDFIKSVIISLSFLLFFVIFIRLFSLFRESKIIDLKYFVENVDLTFIILIMTILFLIRKNVFFVVKLNLIKLHYFGLIDVLPMNPYSKYYSYFYFFFIKKIAKIFYRNTFFLNKIINFVMIILFCYDMVFNHLILNYCLWFAPFYSIFKLFFVFAKFIDQKQDALMDYYLSHLCYVSTGFVPLDRGFYANTWAQRYKEMDKYEKEIIKV